MSSSNGQVFLSQHIINKPKYNTTNLFKCYLPLGMNIFLFLCGMFIKDEWSRLLSYPFYFSCFIVSTRFKFVFQLTKFGVVNLLSVRIRLIVLGISDYSIPRLWIIKVHAILSLARLSRSKHNRNMTFKTNNKT